MMNHAQLLQRISTRWDEFTASYAGLTAADMQTPGVVEDWSVRDILAHVSWWEEEALTHLPTILEGGRPERYSVRWGGIDAFNASMTERRAALSLEEVLELHQSTHARLLDYLTDVPETAIATETRFRRRLRLDTWGHYPIHTEHIRAWREHRVNRD